MNIETKIVQTGMNSDPETGSITVPIYQTATFKHIALGKSTGYDYSRTSNPTRDQLQDSIASLENGDAGFAFSTGMAAITAVLMLFRSGDHIIISDDLYGGTYRVVEEIFKNYNISASFIDTGKTDEVSNAITDNTRAIFIETPSNPMMKITDIRAISNIAKANDLLLITDNTFMTPYFQRPIELGSDIVIHSGTKYLSGHNDVLSGLVVTKTRELSEKIGFIQNSTGAVLSPFDTFLTIRGLKTLSIRLNRQQDNALKIVEFLESNPAVKEVFYPGRNNTKDKEIHDKQATGTGGMISFSVTDVKYIEKILNNVKLISFAESLGGVESLITYPALQTHAAIPEYLRQKLGVDETLLRLSVGIEYCDDLISDLDCAIRS